MPIGGGLIWEKGGLAQGGSSNPRDPYLITGLCAYMYVCISRQGSIGGTRAVTFYSKHPPLDVAVCGTLILDITARWRTIVEV